MKFCARLAAMAGLFGALVSGSASCLAQSTGAPAASASAANSNVMADYPSDIAGVLIQTPQWVAITGTMPAKTKVKHGIAASFSYGAVRSTIVAEYAGPHAEIRVPPSQPVLCICHLISLPGDPIIVRLHAQKGARELDGGKLPVIGSKVAEASQSDAIPADVSHPEGSVWLVRPKAPLPAGEYALMLGAQNIDIFPFTVNGTEGNNPTH